MEKLNLLIKTDLNTTVYEKDVFNIYYICLVLSVYGTMQTQKAGGSLSFLILQLYTSTCILRELDSAAIYTMIDPDSQI